MSDSHVSGTCMFRALCANIPVYDLLKLLYHEVIDPDKFYNRDERIQVMAEFFRKNRRKLEAGFGEKEVEEAVEKEMHYREKSPLPRGYRNGHVASFVSDDTPRVVLEEYPGRVYQLFMLIFFAPSKINKLEKKKILLPNRIYNDEVFARIAKCLNEENFFDLNCMKAFRGFLDVPDVKAIVGHNVEITKISQVSEHNYTYSSKVARIREEVILAQKRTPRYVAKFFDVLLERVMNDHYIYEGSHFEKRMVLLDRLQHLPTGTKGKGMVRNELVIVNDKNRYEIDMESLRKAHLTLALMMDTAAGKEFRAEFVEHMKTTFPGRSEGKPTKSALLFAEKFFVWAASTLEFEKELVEPLRSMYTFGAVPPNKKINIRVIHCTSKSTNEDPPHCQIGFMFIDEIRHALRKYRKHFGPLHLLPINTSFPPPFRPGPKPSIVEFIDASVAEKTLKTWTRNRIGFDPVILSSVRTDELFAFPILSGPFNRHVTDPIQTFDCVTDILVDELRLGIELLPSNPAVAEFGQKMVQCFSGKTTQPFVDLRTMLDLKQEAYSLKKHMTPPCQSPETHNLEMLQVQIMGLLEKCGIPPHQWTVFLRRVVLMRCFPEMGQVLHQLYCDGNLCYLSAAPGFKVFFGPQTLEVAEAGNLRMVACNAPGEKEADGDAFLYDRLLS